MDVMLSPNLLFNLKAFSMSHIVPSKFHRERTGPLLLLYHAKIFLPPLELVLDASGLTPDFLILDEFTEDDDLSLH